MEVKNEVKKEVVEKEIVPLINVKVSAKELELMEELEDTKQAMKEYNFPVKFLALGIKKHEKVLKNYARGELRRKREVITTTATTTK